VTNISRGGGLFGNLRKKGEVLLAFPEKEAPLDCVAMLAMASMVDV